MASPMTSPLPLRKFRATRAALLYLALLTACASTPPPPPPPPPLLTALKFDSLLRPGPLLAGGACISTSTELVAAITLRAALLHEAPAANWQTARRQADLIASSEGPWLLSPKLLDPLRIAFGPLSAPWQSEDRPSLAIRGATTGLSAVLPDSPWQLALLLHASDSKTIKLAIELEQTGAFEVAVFTWPEDQSLVNLLLPYQLWAPEAKNSFGPVLLQLERRPGVPKLSEAELRRISELRCESPPETSASAPMRPASSLSPQVLELARRALTGSAFQRRGALASLTQSLGASLSEQLSICASDESLAALVNATFAKPREDLGLALEQAGLAGLSEAHFGNALEPAQLAAITAFSGALATAPARLNDIVSTARSLDELRADLIAENLAALEEPNERTRCLAWRFLKSYQRAPENYEPTAPAADRRLALDAWQARQNAETQSP